MNSLQAFMKKLKWITFWFKFFCFIYFRMQNKGDALKAYFYIFDFRISQDIISRFYL